MNLYLCFWLLAAMPTPQLGVYACSDSVSNECIESISAFDEFSTLQTSILARNDSADRVTSQDTRPAMVDQAELNNIAVTDSGKQINPPESHAVNGSTVNASQPDSKQPDSSTPPGVKTWLVISAIAVGVMILGVLFSELALHKGKRPSTRSRTGMKALQLLVNVANGTDGAWIGPGALTLAQQFGWSTAQSGFLASLDLPAFLFVGLITAFLFPKLRFKLSRGIVICGSCSLALLELSNAFLILSPSLNTSVGYQVFFVGCRFLLGVNAGFNLFTAICLSSSCSAAENETLQTLLVATIDLGYLAGSLIINILQHVLPGNASIFVTDSCAIALLSIAWSVVALVQSFALPLDLEDISYKNDKGTAEDPTGVAQSSDDFVTKLPDYRRKRIVVLGVLMQLLTNGLGVLAGNCATVFWQTNDGWNLEQISLATIVTNICTSGAMVSLSVFRIYKQARYDDWIIIIAMILAVPGLILWFQWGSPSADGYMLTTGVVLAIGNVELCNALAGGYTMAAADNSKWYSTDLVNMNLYWIGGIMNFSLSYVGRLVPSIGQNAAAVMICVWCGVAFLNFTFLRSQLIAPDEKNEKNEKKGWMSLLRSG